MSFRSHLKLTLLIAVSLLSTNCASLASSPPEPFTLVMLPDTQNYADIKRIEAADRPDLREYFYAQTDWIARNKDIQNIAMVAHAGDIVQHDHPTEWAIASEAFETIDSVVPYILCIGNHDIGRGDAATRSKSSRRTGVGTWFPPERFQNNPLYTYGGNFEDRSDNYYLLFEAGGLEFLILALEFKPRDEALAWANEVVAAHPERRCIVVTHSYLTPEATYDDTSHYDHVGNRGREMWDKFVKLHANIFMVLCGHRIGEAYRVTTGVHGNAVHEMLADYQGMDHGGEGYLRTLTFDPVANEIRVRSFSPSNDAPLTGTSSNFTIPYPMTESKP
jgi:hypothetical protein